MERKRGYRRQNIIELAHLIMDMKDNEDMKERAARALSIVNFIDKNAYQIAYLERLNHKVSGKFYSVRGITTGSYPK
jgi:hypothetical protein